jgi:hypothetical protein
MSTRTFHFAVYVFFSSVYCDVVMAWRLWFVCSVYDLISFPKSGCEMTVDCM